MLRFFSSYYLLIFSQKLRFQILFVVFIFTTSKHYFIMSENNSPKTESSQPENENNTAAETVQSENIEVEKPENENNAAAETVQPENIEVEKSESENNTATETVKIEIEPTKVIAAKNTVNTKKRFTLTSNFSPEEGELIDGIINKRVEAGFSENPSHFVRQCIDFAINFNAANKFVDIKGFGVPDEYTAKLLRNGFYQKYKQIKIDVCK